MCQVLSVLYFPFFHESMYPLSQFYGEGCYSLAMSKVTDNR